jgi:hypothetical protein
MNIIVASPSVSFYQLVCVEGALPPEERNQVSYLSHFVDFVTFLIGNIIMETDLICQWIVYHGFSVRRNFSVRIFANFDYPNRIFLQKMSEIQLFSWNN